MARAQAKAAVYAFANGAWVPTQDGGLSQVGLYENSASGTYRVVSQSVSNPTFVRRRQLFHYYVAYETT